MNVRKYDWFNTKTFTPMYGIQVQHGAGKQWMNVCSGDSNIPCIYETEAERDLKIKELRSR